MPLRWIRSPFHWVFYAALYIFYVAILFGVANLSDAGSLSHTLARLLLPAFELAAVAAAGGWLLRRWLASRAIGWWLLYVALAALTCLSYAVQANSIRMSNNFISVLAIENARDVRLTLSPLTVSVLVLAVAWIALLGFHAWHGTFFPRRRRGVPGQSRLGRKATLVISTVVAVMFAGLLLQQHRNASLEPGYRQTPLASLVANFWSAGMRQPVAAGHSSVAQGMCFKDPGAGGVPGYPFQKRLAYRTALPFSSVPRTDAATNVIVLFTEGLSARLIEAYGGKYPGLTPNIDRLAGRSMKVTNYFNHTAATYRGITGQMTSGFTFANGNTWNAGDHGTILASVNRQSLASILNRAGYATYFFTSHRYGAFTHLLQSLGVGHIYGFEQIAKLLRGDVETQRQTDQLDDASLFRGLREFLEQRAASDVTQPFFIGTYNIGTHAFIPMAAGGKPYGNGGSQILDKVHTYDAALGGFLDWFYRSPYAHNTVLVFTTDHATYPDKPYRAVAGADLKPYFVDRIPLLILDPTHHLPDTWNARGRNSLDLAPTVLQLLGIQRAPNSFLGHSLFEPRSFRIGIAALGANFYLTTAEGVFAVADAPTNLAAEAACERNVVQSYYDEELRDRLFRPAHGPSSPERVAHADAYCALDKINGKRAKSFTHPLRIGQPATLAGWFASSHKARVGAFAVNLTGGSGYFLPAQQDVPRPDVAKAIGGTGPNTYGFTADTNFAGASPGRYAVTFVSGDGESCDTGRYITLTQ